MMCTISAAREAGNEAADVPIHLYGPPGLASFLEAAMELSDTYLLVPVIVHEFVQHSVPGRDAEHQVGPRTLNPLAGILYKVVAVVSQYVGCVGLTLLLSCRHESGGVGFESAA